MSITKKVTVYTVIINREATSFTSAILAARKLEKKFPQPISMAEKLGIAYVIEDLESPETQFPIIRTIGETSLKIYKSTVEISVDLYANLY